MSDEVKNKSEDISDEDLAKIIQEVAEEEKPAAPVTPLRPVKKVNSAEQTLSLELTGAINLKLCFSSGERSIEVFCTEEALLCKMADGTEFKIPTGIHKKAQAA